MPTAIAPRYGDPSAGGLEPYQEPEFGFDTELRFRMRVSVQGVLQSARWASPSHDIAVTPERERTVIEIARPAAMDRDVVLEARAAGADAGRALLDRDDGDWVVLASPAPPAPGSSCAIWTPTWAVRRSSPRCAPPKASTASPACPATCC